MEEIEIKEKRICKKGIQIESCRQCLFETLCHYEEMINEVRKDEE